MRSIQIPSDKPCVRYGFVRQREPLYSMGMKLTRVALLIPMLIGAALDAAPNLADRIERPAALPARGPRLRHRERRASSSIVRSTAATRPSASTRATSRSSCSTCPAAAATFGSACRTPRRRSLAHDAARIVSRYRPGAMLYEIRDPLLGEGVVLSPSWRVTIARASSCAPSTAGLLARSSSCGPTAASTASVAA